LGYGSDALALGLQTVGLAAHGTVRMLGLHTQSLSIFLCRRTKSSLFSDFLNRETLKITRKKNPLWLWRRIKETYE
jgi:hypothetical protein